VFPDGLSVELMVFDSPARAGDARQRRTQEAERAPEPQAPPAPAPGACHVGAPHPPRVGDVETGSDARTCPVCGGHLAYPTDWRRTSRSTWTLHLRCPDCESERDVLLDRPNVERLNRELYRAHQAVVDESRKLSRRNFEEEAERIVAALASGLIQPMDF
jgi:hypothetical protein